MTVHTLTMYLLAILRMFIESYSCMCRPMGVKHSNAHLLRMRLFILLAWEDFHTVMCNGVTAFLVGILIYETQRRQYEGHNTPLG